MRAVAMQSPRSFNGSSLEQKKIALLAPSRDPPARALAECARSRNLHRRRELQHRGGGLVLLHQQNE
jgi:hypothetical protein